MTVRIYAVADLNYSEAREKLVNVEAPTRTVEQLLARLGGQCVYFCTREINLLKKAGLLVNVIE